VVEQRSDEGASVVETTRQVGTQLIHRRRTAPVNAAAQGHEAPMPHTYILECADGSFYVGSTFNLDKRLFMHNLGVGSAYTRPSRRRPVKLAWSGEFETIGAAFAFEKQVQNWGRAKRIALIEGRLGDLPALARGRNRPPKPPPSTHDDA